MAVHGPGSLTQATGKAIKVTMPNGSNNIQSATKVHQTMTQTKTRVLRKKEKQKIKLIKNMKDSKTKAFQMSSLMK
jgi:hypothetical protein